MRGKKLTTAVFVRYNSTKLARQLIEEIMIRLSVASNSSKRVTRHMRPVELFRQRTILRLTCVLIGLVSAFMIAFAQNGSFHGQVTDQNGAIVVGAKVTARSSTGQFSEQ